MTAIRTINGGASCTNSSASPKASSNLETWFSRMDTRGKEIVDFTILWKHEQWKDQHQVRSLFPMENFSKDLSNQQ